MEDSEMNVRDISISEIKTADRIRKDAGNITELAEDIQAHGLINPITVMEQENGYFLLITGFRRMQACKQLGLSQISASVLSPLDASERLMIEISENEKRQDFTAAERVEYGQKIKAVEREKALSRMSVHARDGHKKKQGMDGGRYPEEDTSNVRNTKSGTTRDFVAKAVGFGSGRQFERAEYLARHNPELLQEVDKGKITLSAAYEQARKEKLKSEGTVSASTVSESAAIENTVAESTETGNDVAGNAESAENDSKSISKNRSIQSNGKLDPVKAELLCDTVPSAESEAETESPSNSLTSSNSILSSKASSDDTYQTTGIPANSNAPCYLGMQGADNWEPIKPIQLFKIKTPKNGGHEALLANPLYAAVYEKYTEAMQSCNLVLGCWDQLKDGYETRIRGDQTNITTLIRARDKAENQVSELSSEVKTLKAEKDNLQKALSQVKVEKEECIKEENNIESRWAEAESKRRKAEGESKALRIEVEALKRELYGK